jgi:hypothetical protein
LGGHWREFPDLSRKDSNILLPFTISYLCETAFSAVAAIGTKDIYMMDMESDLRAAIS